MIIDCDTCQVRDLHCRDCAVGALLSSPGVPGLAGLIEFNDAERCALELLADQGLLPPLRLVPALPREPGPQSGIDCDSAIA